MLVYPTATLPATSGTKFYTVFLPNKNEADSSTTRLTLTFINPNNEPVQVVTSPTYFNGTAYVTFDNVTDVGARNLSEVSKKNLPPEFRIVKKRFIR